MAQFYVVDGHGRRFEGNDLGEMQRNIEYTVKALVKIGSGLIITDCSPELESFLLDLRQQYPSKICRLAL
ncbi:MAG: hypothetical protein E5W90_31600 [Mesorhizobium sp.]|nr:MAG: hypothetical protein E5W90_31600 [Mesorhizobium sp.]